MVALCNRETMYIFMLWFVLSSSSFFSSPNLSRRRLDVCHTFTLGTIAQLCRAISLQLRHVSTIGKKLVKQQYVLHMSPQYGGLRPTTGWDRLTSLGYPCKFQLVSRLGSVTARHLVVDVSQTLRRWTDGATYIGQGDHQVGHWPTFLFCVILSFSWLVRVWFCSVRFCLVTTMLSDIDYEEHLWNNLFWWISKYSWFSGWLHVSPQHHCCSCFIFTASSVCNPFSA